jgi:hypothetical protein
MLPEQRPSVAMPCLLGLVPVGQGRLREPGQVLLAELAQVKLTGLVLLAELAQVELTGQRLPVAFV